MGKGVSNVGASFLSFVAEHDVREFQVAIAGSLRIPMKDGLGRLLLRVFAQQLLIDPQADRVFFRHGCDSSPRPRRRLLLFR